MTSFLPSFPFQNFRFVRPSSSLAVENKILLQRACSKNDSEQLFRIYSHLSPETQTSLSYSQYESIFRVLSKQQSPNIISYIDRLYLDYSSRFPHSGTIYGAIMKAYVLNGRLDRATNLMIQGLDAKFPLTPQNCQPVINGYLNKDDPGQALRVIQLLKHHGVKLDVVTYTAVVTYFANKGDVTTSLTWLNRILLEGLRPTEVTFNSIIIAYLKQGQLQPALNVMREMKMHHIAPSVITFTIFTKWFMKWEKPELALDFMEKLKEYGVVLDIAAYNLLLRCLVKSNALEDVDALFQYVKNSGLALTSSTYVPVLERHLRQERISKAQAIFKEFVSSPACHPRDLVVSHCFAIMLGYYTKHSRWNEALDEFRFMRNRHLPIDATIYDIMTGKRYGNPGRNLETWKIIWNQTLQHGKVDAGLGCILIQGYVGIHYLNRALDIYHVLRQFHLDQQKKALQGQPTEDVFDLITCQALMNACIKQLEFKRFSKFLLRKTIKELDEHCLILKEMALPIK